MKPYKQFLEESQQLLINEAKLTQTEQEFINRLFYGKENSTQRVSHFEGSHIRGTRTQSGKQDYKTARKLAKKGIIEIVDTDNSGMSKSFFIKLKDKSATNISLSKKQINVLSSVAIYMARILKSDKKAIQLPGINMTAATRKQISTLEKMNMVYDTGMTTGSYVLTKDGAEALKGNVINTDANNVINSGVFGEDFVRKNF